MASLTDYEKERQSNIELNKSRMNKLGVQSIVPVTHRKHVKQIKRSITKAIAEPTRKSARLQQIPAVDYKLPEDFIEIPYEKTNRNFAKTTRVQKTFTETVPPPDSCKVMSADLSILEEDLIGTKLYPEAGFGPKAYVMARLRGVRDGKLSAPRFSKYSGIQEWKNCIVLFVNVCGKSGELYENVFLEDYSFMTWYAQKHHYIETPIIQRIIKMTKGDDEPVILFCRQEGDAYVFCGKVKYHELHCESRPLKFVWKLFHAATLQKAKDFLSIVESGL